jgi:hypothetical protein
MKQLTIFALLSIAALIAVPTTHAQVQLKAKVPFAFTVADKPLPAGEYSICSPDRGVLRLVNSEQHTVALVAAVKGHSDPNGKNLIVFARYGDQYFLRQIVSQASEGLNVNVPLFNREKRARSSENVLIAAR